MENCPNCGADLPRQARVCPECGSDDETGWSEAAETSHLGLPDDSFDYDKFVEKEFAPKKRRPMGWLGWTALTLLLLILAGLLFAFLYVRRVGFIVFLFAILAVASAGAGDWPQFLGPERNGRSAETNLALRWPKEGPRPLWQRKVGQGFSGPVVADGKLILFHRIENSERIECLNATNRSALWQFEYRTAYRDDFGFDEGPRATPAISGGKVFTYGAEGMLTCLDFASGRRLWKADCRQQFHAPKGFFGIACSPLVEAHHVILNVGGDNAGIVAFDEESGALVWKATRDQASYASPTAATIAGRRYLFAFTRSGLAGLEPDTGKIHFEFPWRSPMEASVNAATPLVIGNFVFISASYEAGAALIEVTPGGPKKVWSGNDSLSNHYATCVEHDGFLFGFHGRQEMGQEFRCVELKSGKVRWAKSGLGAGTVTLAGNRLLVMTEGGELLEGEASPENFVIRNRAQVLPFEVRAAPALAGGVFYARSKNNLVALDLK